MTGIGQAFPALFPELLPTLYWRCILAFPFIACYTSADKEKLPVLQNNATSICYDRKERAVMSQFFNWLLSLLLAFGLGLGVSSGTTSDSELKQKVQDHMDVIVDESAAIVDDVVDEIRKDEHVKDTEKFFDDVSEIIDNTKQDIHDHFGGQDEEEDEDGETDDAETESAEPDEEISEDAVDEGAEESEAAEEAE